MYSTLVVPLDGSPVAEQALPVAVSIARRHGASLHLVYAHTTLVQPLQVQGAPLYDTRFDHDRIRELDAYLARVAERLGGDLTVTHSVVSGGSAAEAIAEEAGKRGADLVVITTHGRSGFSRVWMGSVATELLRSSPVPVLVARDSEDAATAPRFPEGGPSHILVPIEGSEISEAAVDAALRMGGEAGGVRYTLLQVVITADTRLPYDQTFWTPAEQEFLDGQQAVAREYVNGVVERLRGRGVEAEGVVTIEADAARAIIRTAEERGAELVAMSTHARAGVARLMLGSVTDKVIRGAHCPVLVVRPGE